MSKKGSSRAHEVFQICYSNMIKKGVCDEANAIHALNRFNTSLGKENWYSIHFSLPDEQCKFVVAHHILQNAHS